MQGKRAGVVAAVLISLASVTGWGAAPASALPPVPDHDLTFSVPDANSCSATVNFSWSGYHGRVSATIIIEQQSTTGTLDFPPVAKNGRSGSYAGSFSGGPHSQHSIRAHATLTSNRGAVLVDETSDYELSACDFGS